MKDIQFWLYLGFAVIYFLSRFLKKTPPKPVGSEDAREQSDRAPRKALTFDELLREFTAVQENPERVEEQEIEEMEIEEEPLPTRKPYQEGRQFADDESKRVYEESIRLAEGADLKFEREEQFKSKIKRLELESESNDDRLESLMEMLRDKEGARKAVILSEILNKRY